ncbi:MAG TPA: UDP-N-acetylmuramoyl-L-alanyl-D-glutamate--2,6-diaminopimelate ligase [Solirubrobacteraceae bacterium]|jgi:UDP-N-acetylmuramoyl-L-alanyl-D-glutamate--2,6-diaminopimelate ligase|nr:UDP-N-acetylmuramoyl-L-alanyl-D-glutamate--2,6-diaminopimelate ligase [Solirubrobacteraceae bacterium]
MRLDGLIAAELAGEAAGVEITGLAYDSRDVAPGDLFFCVSGFRSDGHEFAAEAVRAGAAALVVERRLDLGLPEVLVESARAAMAPAAASFYGDPARELRVVGVTGTNGKTTTAYLVRALLEATGTQCGLLGTVKSVVGGDERMVARTTPEAIDLQADLRAMLDGGDRACAIEVSSHALELGRVDAIAFAVAVFTNLTQDHLDFHASMEDYFQAKRRLFLPVAPAVSVINVGDEYGRRLAGEIDGAITFAVDAPADYSATDLRCGLDGCRFTLSSPGGRREVALPMPGRFNVANALGALAAADALTGELDVLVAALERGVRVPGRFEPVDAGQEFAVLVDYAHTPDSLENVLAAARELVAEAGGRGRVICVFGAGGDRDRGKRPLMGAIAARLADVAIVTSDNPRSEDPQRIIDEIMAGVASRAGEQGGYDGIQRPGAGATAHVRAIADRRAAIEHAIAIAASGDVLIIAGKGHEQGQEFADGHKLPFDDASVARAALERRQQEVPIAAERSQTPADGAQAGAR